MNPIDLAKPVVWTCDGNINEDLCEVHIGFVPSEDGSSIAFVKEHRLKDGGRQVKREVHICILKGLEAQATNAPVSEENPNV